MEKSEFEILYNYPLEIKIEKSKLRIMEFVEQMGEENCYISFSGGKDSTVLLHLIRSLFPEMTAVFIDTGLEYPEIKQFVKSFDNIEILKPKMNFKEVIDHYGYPIISKENSNYLSDIKTGSEKLRLRRLNGDSLGRFKLPKKYHYLINAPFKISHQCCNVMKKRPIKAYENKTGKFAFIGTLACESSLRKQQYLKHGCNAFNKSRPTSQPLGFWSEQDILNYIKVNKLEIASVYGDIVVENNILKTTGCDRTGCVFCAFGVHMEQSPNRFERLKVTHPKLHNYCINKLGMGEVLDYINVRY